MVLEGIVPVLIETPPTTERASTTATLFFILVPATGARCPEGPEPMTMRSYLMALMRVSLSPGDVIDSTAVRSRRKRRRPSPGGYHSAEAVEEIRILNFGKAGVWPPTWRSWTRVPIITPKLKGTWGPVRSGHDVLIFAARVVCLGFVEGEKQILRLIEGTQNVPLLAQVKVNRYSLER